MICTVWTGNRHRPLNTVITNYLLSVLPALGFVVWVIVLSSTRKPLSTFLLLASTFEGHTKKGKWGEVWPHGHRTVWGRRGENERGDGLRFETRTHLWSISVAFTQPEGMVQLDHTNKSLTPAVSLFLPLTLPGLHLSWGPPSQVLIREVVANRF